MLCIALKPIILTRCYGKFTHGCRIGFPAVPQNYRARYRRWILHAIPFMSATFIPMCVYMYIYYIGTRFLDAMNIICILLLVYVTPRRRPVVVKVAKKPRPTEIFSSRIHCLFYIIYNINSIFFLLNFPCVFFIAFILICVYRWYVHSSAVNNNTHTVFLQTLEFVFNIIIRVYVSSVKTVFVFTSCKCGLFLCRSERNENVACLPQAA